MSMTEDGYGELAKLARVTKCIVLRLENCDLNKKKLDGLLKEFVKADVKIETLDIRDKSMTEVAYGVLANLLPVTKCETLFLVNCDLNKIKLAEVSTECKKGEVKIETLGISDKSMTEDGYGELANVANVTKCNQLSFTDCELNKNKLAKLSEECRKGNVQIEHLFISDKLMTIDGYSELSNVVNVRECTHLALMYCELNESKLTEMAKECEYGNMKEIYHLTIHENHSASDEEVSALCDLMIKKVICLGLENWKIDATGIERLKDIFRQKGSKILIMELPNGESVFRYGWMLQLHLYLLSVLPEKIALLRILKVIYALRTSDY